MEKTTNDKTEKEVKAEVNRYLKSLGEGCFFPYNPYGGRPGVPDKIGCYRGRFVGIECKKPSLKGTKNGGLRPAQVSLKREIERNYGFYIVAYGKRDVEVFFKQFEFTHQMPITAEESLIGFQIIKKESE